MTVSLANQKQRESGNPVAPRRRVAWDASSMAQKHASRASRRPARRIIAGAALLLLALMMTLPCFAAKKSRARKSEIIAHICPQSQVRQPGQIDARKLTRINYAFANLQDGKIVEGYASDPQNYAALNLLKQQNPSLKIVASVGGWLWSGNFSDMVLTKKSREVFIKSAEEFIEKYQLDG